MLLVFYVEQDALKWYCTQLVRSLHIGIVMLSCAERKNLAKSNDLASEEMSETKVLLAALVSCAVTAWFCVRYEKKQQLFTVIIPDADQLVLYCTCSK